MAFDKYLITGHKFGLLKRGGYTIPKRFCEEHSDKCVFIEDLKVTGRLKKLNDSYRRLIFWTQVPRCYNPKIYFTQFRNLNHVIYLRNEHVSPFFNSCQNGFHYYKQHPKIEHYVPLITNFKVNKEPNTPCLGFYCRPQLTPDSMLFFNELVSSLKYKVHVFILGEDFNNIRNNSNTLSYRQTYDNVEFFESVTHYVYPTSKKFVDPFPHSVLEAVQTGKQIIFPKIERSHKDGIDDLKDCIKWHSSIDFSKNYDNSNCVLKSENFKKFYKKVFENNFEYNFDRTKYKTMMEWIEKEVI